jgi:nucleoside-diphosphate-sugar epimerase
LFVWKGVIDFFTRSTRTSNSLFRKDFGWFPRFPSFDVGLKQVIETWKTEGFAN